jgi:hypothetical protein
MNFSNSRSLELPLLGGVVQAQLLHVPPQVIHRLTTYREACRMAWKLRRVRNLTRAQLAEMAGLYASHVSDYFSLHEKRRELPAKQIGSVERVLGNSVISQFVAYQATKQLMVELQGQLDHVHALKVA